MDVLLSQVVEDAESFFNRQKSLLFNEADLQHELSFYLRNTGHYDEVRLEYFIPAGVVKEYHNLWNSAIRVDIVVSKDDEYVPIELKYKTAELDVDLPRFGQIIPGIHVLKDDVAYDMGSYECWKDVKRLELLRARFSKIVGGLFIMLTNSRNYITGPRPTSNYVHFSMQEGHHDQDCHWLDDTKSAARDLPGFTLQNSYDIHWEKVPNIHSGGNKNSDFYYTLLTI